LSSTINASNSGFGGVVTTGDSSGVLQLQTANTTAVTIDTSQNVGIGTTNPTGVGSAKILDVYGGSSSNGQIIVEGGNGTNFLTAYSGTSSGDLPAIYFNQSLRFATATAKDATGFTERMRIDSSGNAFIGCTTTNNYTVRLSLSQNSGTTTWCVGPSASSPNNFYIAATGSTGVYLNGTAATSWTSASDERLKENLEPIANAIDKVSTLRAVIGNFISDEDKTKKPFLIAQDVEKVLPEAISINKTDDGNEYLGLAYTDTIPLLVAAIKEQQTIINDLKARIETLEAK